MKKLSFVIPCYRSEQSIAEVVDEIVSTISKTKYEYEVILVNDNSPDNVLDVIVDLSKKYNEVKGISFSKNFGQHSALMAGYARATGDVIVSMDDDGQTPVNEVERLVSKLSEGYDVVFAEYEEIKQSGFRKWGSSLNSKMTEMMANKPKDVVPTSYFVARRYIIQEMLRYTGPYPYIGGLIYRITNNITNVKVEHRNRKYGSSNYTLFKLISMWSNGLTAFSIKPLRLATLVGAVCSFIGIIYGIIRIVIKICNPQVAMGYSSLIVAILFIGGINMALLGIVGEYVGRIYICLNSSPQYLIKSYIENGNIIEC